MLIVWKTICFVFCHVLKVWTQVGGNINGEALVDENNISVALSSDGTTVAIGSYGNTLTGIESGYTRVYKNLSGVWTQMGGNINGEAAGDYSGYSVSLASDGNTVAIGAYGNDATGNNSGHVRVFKNIVGVWTQVGSDIDGEGTNDNSGYSVSLSSDGTTVAIGAPFNNGNGTSSGHVRIFKNIAGVWTQIGSDIDGEGVNNNSGSSISLSADGSIVAIGAPGNNDNFYLAGQVRIYKNVTNVWTQLGGDINGEAFYDQSGSSVCLSSDGIIVAIGAFGNDANGSNSGHVRVYKNELDVWTQVGLDIDDEAIYDSSGFSISLSSNGSIIAIGAPFNSGNGDYSGHVRVYDLSAVLSIKTEDLGIVSVYPNPVSNVLTIDLKNNIELQQVNFYNILGQLVKTTTTKQIIISELAKGYYIVEIITDQGKATKKININ